MNGVLAAKTPAAAAAAFQAQPKSLAAAAAAPQQQHLSAMTRDAMDELKSRSLSRRSSLGKAEDSHRRRRHLLEMGDAVWRSQATASALAPVGGGQPGKFLFLAERPLGRGASDPGTTQSDGVLKTLLFQDGTNHSLLVEVNHGQAVVGVRVGAATGGARGEADTTSHKYAATANGKMLETIHVDAEAGGQTAGDEGTSDAGQWAGKDGWIVLWLRVEGFTALFLPVVSMFMLCLGLQDSQFLSATLYIVAIFQALCLGVGCVWSFGGFVPNTCIQGTVGDPFAYNAMWWVCTVWLGVIVSISTVICCILCCFVGAFVRQKEKYRYMDDENQPA